MEENLEDCIPPLLDIDEETFKISAVLQSVLDQNIVDPDPIPTFD
jgi:hypothetical protein